jgi:glycine/D-amino acid oxidase-like deaminating enzyme
MAGGLLAKRIIVIGAGIVGASVAWHLAKTGAAVTVIEEGKPGGVATANSWAWINASWGNPESYFRLRMRSIAEWRKIDSEVEGLGVNWCGGLIWDLPEAELDAYARERADWGHPLRPVGRPDMARIEPNLRVLPERAYHVAGEGMLEPVPATLALIAAAQGLGAEVLADTPIKWLIEDHGRVSGVMTNDGVIHADEIVVAAGAGSAQLLDTIGIGLKMTAPAGLLSHSKPAPKLLNGLVMSPGLHLRQTAEGRIVAGTDFAGADPEGNAAGLAAELHAKCQEMVRGVEGLELDFFTVGYRPTPADGFSAIGRPQNREGLYAVVTHSGVTLAPVLGRFAATEILGGERDPLLAAFHPDRPALQ